MSDAADAIVRELRALGNPAKVAGGSRAGRWVAADALRELTSPAIQQRLG